MNDRPKSKPIVRMSEVTLGEDSEQATSKMTTDEVARMLEMAHVDYGATNQLTPEHIESILSDDTSPKRTPAHCDFKRARELEAQSNPERLDSETSSRTAGDIAHLIAMSSPTIVPSDDVEHPPGAERDAFDLHSDRDRTTTPLEGARAISGDVDATELSLSMPTEHVVSAPTAQPTHLNRTRSGGSQPSTRMLFACAGLIVLFSLGLIAYALLR